MGRLFDCQSAALTGSRKFLKNNRGFYIDNVSEWVYNTITDKVSEY